MTKWKTMEIGKVYETLAKMTPEERFASLEETRRELSSKISSSMKNSQEKLKKEFFDFVDDNVQTILHEYEDETAYPTELLRENVIEVIKGLPDDDQYWDILTKYIKGLI